MTTTNRRLAVILLLGALWAPACGTNGDPAEPAIVERDGPPPDIAALTADGRVIVLDARTGEELRPLALGAETDLFRGIALSPDERTVYFVRLSGLTDYEVVQTPFRGAEVRPAAVGAAPAVSPDGRRLATVALAEGQDSARIMVHALVGEEPRRSWELEPREGTDPAAFVHSASWAPDSRHLGYLVSFPQHGEVFLLDTATEDSLWDGRGLRPEGVEGTWNRFAFRGATDAIGVVAGCCAPDFAQWWRIDSVGTEPGSAVEPLLDLPGPATWISFDRSGRHLLYILDDVLYRWDGEGEATRLAEGIIAADW